MSDTLIYSLAGARRERFETVPYRLEKTICESNSILNYCARISRRRKYHDLIECLNRLDSDKNSEIIVVDGAREKDTLEAIHRNHVIKISCEKGRARQMNAGASTPEERFSSFSMRTPNCLSRPLERSDP